MSATVRTVKLEARDATELSRLTYQNGEIYYDQTNKTLRLMDSIIQGGFKIATHLWIQDDLQTLNNTISFTNPLQSTSKTTGAVKIAGGVGIVKNLYVGGNLVVDGVISLGNATNIANSFSVSTDKFTVNHITGNGSFAGTLDVASDLKINTNKFVVTATSGNTTVAGTLDVANDLRVNTNKFSVAYSSGNTLIAGDLSLTGNVTTEIKALRNFSVATNKFTVDYLTGNTAVAGTLDVTGLSTLATARVSDLTLGRITYAGTSGRLKDSAELTWDESELYVSGNIRATGNLTVDGNFTLSGTSITLGNSDTDGLTITADLTSNIVPDAPNTYDLGTSSKRWRKLWANTLDVSGATNLDGNFTIATDKFTIDATSGAAIHNGAVTINGTMTVNGPTINTTTTNVTTSSSVIEVHTSAEPLASDDGKDLGVVIHYYKTTAEQLAFLGWKNSSQELVYYTGATNTLGTYTGTLGVIKAGSFTTADAGSFKADGSGGITTSQTTFPLVNATATTVNFGGAATAINMGAGTGTTTVNHNLAVNGGTVSTSASTANIVNTTATTVNFGGAATTVNIGSSTGTFTVNNASAVFNSTGAVQIPAGNNGARPGTGINGMIRYNTEISAYEGYTGTNWTSLGGVKSVDGLTYIIAETTPGASNDELEFYSNGAKVGGWNGTRLLVSNSENATSTATGAVRVSGGLSTTLDAWIGGTLTATALTESSSIALKENVNPITNALALIQQLEGVTYDRRNGTAKNEAGLIAEAVDKVLPNIVKHDHNGNPEGINYTKLTAYLIEAVKELTAKVERLSK